MRRLPGDGSMEETVADALRVNHAGEYGAKRIYEGQLAVLKRSPKRGLIEEMAAQEAHHLATFETRMRQGQVRPTVLMPLWHVAGYALGAATAILGEKAAFACTVAVESVIDEHYAKQEKVFAESHKELAQTIAVFRAEEREHHDTSLAQDAQEAPFYPVLSAAVKGASRLAIWLSTRI